jgi:phage terminase large subunit-like protein
MTRWHEDDPAGRILPEDWNGESGFITARDGEVWDVLCIPACAGVNDALGRKEGDWLWTDWFSESFWKQERISQGGRNWSALYQQIPSPDEGVYFKRENFWRFNLKDIPSVRKYQTADFAVTEEAEADDPDYTEIGVHGAAKSMLTEVSVTKLYLCLDGWSGRTAPEKWVHEYYNLVMRHKPLCEFAEVGVIRRATEGLLRQQRLTRRATGSIEWMPHVGDKSANARALQAMSQMGLVGIANTEYGDYCLEQLIKFPAGKYDDAVDMLALFGRAVDEAHPMITVPGIPEEKKDRYDWDDEPDYDWAVG